MPNVGKPSKGCKNCRDRKVKCDQKRPSCSQCIRIGKDCHGYRDPLSMMFKNESEVVVTKAQKRYEKLAKQKDQKASSQERSLTNESTTSTRQPATNMSLSRRRIPPGPLNAIANMVPSIEDQALGFFMANFVMEPSIVPRGNFEWVPELMNRPDAERIIRSSVIAASLAGLANSTKSPSIKKRAQEEYATALTLTNKALQSTETAIKDSTLVSVIMLGMYENSVYEDKNSLQAWANHVKGACALLTLRGPEQFKDSFRMRLFQQFYGTILLVSLETDSKIPEGAAQLYEASSSAGDYSVHGKQSTRMVRFMRDAVNLTQDKRNDPATMVGKALELDRELDSIEALLPNIWKYETVYLEKPAPHVFGNFYHIYLDPWIAQMTNNFRSCRLHLRNVLRAQLTKGLEQNPPLFPIKEAEAQIKVSEEATRNDLADICASIPQLTGQIPFPDLPASALDLSTSCSDIFDKQNLMFQLHPPGTFLNPLRAVGMHHLIFPLYLVGRNSLSPPELTQWAIDQLFFVALKIGTRQAVMLAEDLKQLLRSGSVSEMLEND